MFNKKRKMNFMQFLISHEIMKRRNHFWRSTLNFEFTDCMIFISLFSCACWMQRKTERSRTTCGWTCPMKTAVTGWCLWDLLRTTWSRIWWPTSMAQRYFTQQSRTSSLNKNLRSARFLAVCRVNRTLVLYLSVLFSILLSLPVHLQVWYAASYAEFVNQKIHDVTEEERKGDLTQGLNCKQFNKIKTSQLVIFLCLTPCSFSATWAREQLALLWVQSSLCELWTTAATSQHAWRQVKLCFQVDPSFIFSVHIKCIRAIVTHSLFLSYFRSRGRGRGRGRRRFGTGRRPGRPPKFIRLEPQLDSGGDKTTVRTYSFLKS